MTSSRSNWLVAKIYSEDYCCLYGYLKLCKARGERVEDMAANIGVSPDALWYHYRRLSIGAVQCSKLSTCMQPLLKEIEDEKKPGLLQTPANPGEIP